MTALPASRPGRHFLPGRTSFSPPCTRAAQAPRRQTTVAGRFAVATLAVSAPRSCILALNRAGTLALTEPSATRRRCAWRTVTHLNLFAHARICRDGRGAAAAPERLGCSMHGQVPCIRMDMARPRTMKGCPRSPRSGRV
jgi:hypothetical protein